MESNYSPPHIRHKSSSAIVMSDVIIAMIPLYIMAYFYYGIRPLILGLISVTVCFATDSFCKLLARQKISPLESSSVVTGMMIPLLLPASIDISVIILAGLFAMLVAKHPFGGLGQNIFNPAAAGIAFVTISFSSTIFLYPVPMEMKLGFHVENVTLVSSTSSLLNLGGVPVVNPIDMLFGNVAGPMGATSILVLITCLIYLVLRGTIRWHMPLIYIGVSGLLSMIFIRANMSMFDSLMYELSSGVLIFVSVFMITDPVTSPSRDIGRMLYAALAAVLTMLFRHIGVFEQTAVFVILIMNSITLVFDNVGEIVYNRLRRVKLESCKNKKTN